MKQITVNFVISIDEQTQKFLGTFRDGLFRPHWPAAEAAPGGEPEAAGGPVKEGPKEEPKDEAPAPEPEKPAPKKAPAKKPAARKKEEPPKEEAPAAPADPREAAAANLAAIEAAAIKDGPAPAPAMPDAGTQEYQELLQKVGKLGASVAVKDKDGAIAKMTEVIGVPRLDKANFAQLQTLLGIFEEMAKEVG